MKGNGKGYPRGTVVDLMETTGKWYKYPNYQKPPASGGNERKW